MQPLPLINNSFAVYVGLIYSYLPFMVLPLYAALEKLDPALARGGGRSRLPPAPAFWRVTLPLSLPGIIAGALLVFIPMCGEFVIPDLLGGPDTLMIGKVLWDEFFTNRDWPLASAVAVAMLVLLVAADGAAAQRYLTGGAADMINRRVPPFLARMLTLGFVFLYGPIVSVIVYSFNASRLVTVWAGFSTRWYGELLQNEPDQERRAASASRSRSLRRDRRADPRHARRLRAVALSPLPRPHPVRRAGDRAAGDARSHHRASRCCCCSSRWSSDRLAARPRHARPSSSRISRSAWPMSRWWSRRGSPLRPLARGGGARSRRAAGEGLRRDHPAADRAGAGRGLAARLHPLARRSGDREFHLRPGGDDPADGDLLQRAAGRSPQINALATIVVAVAAGALILSGWLTRRRA